MESYGSDSDEKVLRLTASDAASVLLQISFSYRLKEENLAELYKEHGFNWKTSIQSNTRSLLRNEGAQFRALDYVKDSQRIVIEKAFDTAMRKYFKIIKIVVARREVCVDRTICLKTALE